jgi:DNA polymerase phi
VIEKIKELFFKGPIINVDQLNLVIGIQNSLPEIDVSEQFSNWKSQNILELPNLARLASILKEIPADTQEALADWKPQLHSVWDPILSIYLDGGENKNIASFQEFWTIAVDSKCISKE